MAGDDGDGGAGVLERLQQRGDRDRRGRLRGGTHTTSSGGGQGGADPTCHGDPTAWDAIEKTSIACGANSDCCVVVNPCTAESQVVHADDFAEAEAVWPYCDDACVFCIAEYVDLACVAGECVASPPPAGAEPQEGVSQCGVDGVLPSCRARVWSSAASSAAQPPHPTARARNTARPPPGCLGRAGSRRSRASGTGRSPRSWWARCRGEWSGTRASGRRR